MRRVHRVDASGREPSNGRWVGLLAVLAALTPSLLVPSQSAAAGSEFFGIAQGPAIDAHDVQVIDALGAGSVRFLVEWRYAEPSAGTFRWGGTDSKIGSLAARGIRAAPFVWGCPTWAGCSGPSRPPVDSASAIQAWQTFLKALVGRYGPGGSYWSNGYRQQYPGATPLPVHSWQVWNEPNLTKYLDPGGTVAQAALKYARLLRYSHDAIKAKDPRALVVLAGMLANGDSLAWDFLNGLYGVSGFKGDFEVAALHPYATDLSDFTNYIQKFRTVMAYHNDGATPLWLTELGWGSGTPGNWINVGLTGQRDRLNASFRLLLKNRSAWNIQRLFWFTWRDPAPDSSYAHLCTFCGTAGLLHHNRTPKPAYGAYKAFSADTTPPTPSITAGPAQGGFTNDSTPTFFFASNEDGSTFACRVDGADFESCSSPYTASALAGGPHAFEVKATDAAGNQSSTVASRQFKLDTAAPDVTIEGPHEVATTKRTASATFTLNVSEHAHLRCGIGSGKRSSCSSPYVTPRRGQGTGVLKVEATDRAGNVGIQRKRFAIVRKLWPPVPLGAPGAPSHPRCRGVPATLIGSGHPDRLRGTGGPDVIVGFGGDDKINGRGGDDLICARHGGDEVTGGPGDDVVRGGPGSDQIRGGAGRDSINGGLGSDVCRGAPPSRASRCGRSLR
jgi:hypothetical protein